MRKVSVIVPTYRRCEDLSLALESLAGQSFSDMEIILVDDNGSADWNKKVAQVVGSFCRAFPQISLEYIVNESNQGSATARNIGIARAGGAYVTFLDDDDIYLPEKLALQLDFMEQGGYDYSITDLMLYNKQGKLVDRRVRNYIRSYRQEDLRKYHLKYRMTGTDTMMFRREYLEKIGGFAPIDSGDEFYLMQRAIEGGGKFGYLPGCHVKACVHTGEGGMSSGDGKIQGEKALYEYKKSLFSTVDRKTRRYIRMRHYAVLAYAELRRQRYLPFFGNSLCSFFCAPIACVKMLLRER